MGVPEGRDNEVREETNNAEPEENQEMNNEEPPVEDDNEQGGAKLTQRQLMLLIPGMIISSYFMLLPPLELFLNQSVGSGDDNPMSFGQVWFIDVHTSSKLSNWDRFSH